MSRCASVRFDSGRKMLALESTRCSSVDLRPPRRRVRGVDRARRCRPGRGRPSTTDSAPTTSRQVVVQQLGVAPQAVTPPARLVGEPEAGEVEHAHAVARAQLLGDLEPVDAARREAVHERQDRRVRVAELHVEDVSRAPRSRRPGSTRSTCRARATPRRVRSAWRRSSTNHNPPARNLRFGLSLTSSAPSPSSWRERGGGESLRGLGTRFAQWRADGSPNRPLCDVNDEDDRARQIALAPTRLQQRRRPRGWRPQIVRTNGLAGFRRRTCYAVQCGSDGWRGDWSGSRRAQRQVAASLGTKRWMASLAWS